MSVGSNIKSLRSRKGLTQAELANKLHVSFQAVSRWENDQVEPSIDTIKEMMELFECSYVDILGATGNAPKVEEKKEEAFSKEDQEAFKQELSNEIREQVKSELNVHESKPVLGVCENCNKPIYSGNDLKRNNLCIRGASRGRSAEYRMQILCKSCDDKRIAKEAEIAKAKRKAELNALKKRRIHSYIWSALASILVALIAVYYYKTGDTTTGNFFVACAVMAFPFTSCMILFNNFIPDMWVSIATWGVKFPGVIFSFDLGGLVFLIVVKLIFVVLGFLISLCAITFATLLGFVVSVFVYPYALVKNIRGVE